MSVRRWIVAGAVVVAVTAGGLTYHGRSAVTSSATCSHSGYSRAKFGNQPSPVVRKRIIARDGLVDAYTGTAQPAGWSPDADHVVPLSWAWDHGACRWTTLRRIRFASDLDPSGAPTAVPHELVLTSAHLNRQKGDKPPSQWLPPVDPCRYVGAFLAIADAWDLTVPASERRAVLTC